MRGVLRHPWIDKDEPEHWCANDHVEDHFEDSQYLFVLHVRFLLVIVCQRLYYSIGGIGCQRLFYRDLFRCGVSSVVIVSKNETVVLLTLNYMKRKENSVMLVKKQRSE